MALGEAAAQKATENKTGRYGSHVETKLCGGNSERRGSDKRRSTNEDEERSPGKRHAQRVTPKTPGSHQLPIRSKLPPKRIRRRLVGLPQIDPAQRENRAAHSEKSPETGPPSVQLIERATKHRGQHGSDCRGHCHVAYVACSFVTCREIPNNGDRNGVNRGDDRLHMRKARNTQMLDANRQPNDATRKSNKAARITGRLPKRSDNGPITSCNNALTAAYPAMHRLTSA